MAKASIQLHQGANASMTHWEPQLQLLDFPFELQEHISIFLLSSSIPSLIAANRQFRSIYEQILYRHINLYAQPHRSNALLRTFTLRPDLALLVRSLDIDLRYSALSMLSGQLSLSPARQARLDALASARNVRSFGLSGVAWLWGERMKDIQCVVSKMELTSLRIHECRPTQLISHLRNKAGVYANLRAVLQGQPRLQDLELKYFLLRMEAACGVRNPIGIQSPDGLSLRALKADAYTVASILPVVGDQLESLEMHHWMGNNTKSLTTSFSSFTATRDRIRKLHLSMRWNYDLCWDFDFGRLLELLPNVESLRITGSSSYPSASQCILLETYFDKVTSQITRSPNLTKLETSFDFELEQKLNLLIAVREDLGLNLKRSCPSLKTFIDPMQREWAFVEEAETTGDAFRLVRVGQLYCRSADFGRRDLSGLEWEI